MEALLKSFLIMNTSLDENLTRQFQANFFRCLQKRFAKKAEMIEQLSILLEIEPTNCYKRVNGEVALTLRGLLSILKHFNLPWEEVKDCLPPPPRKNKDSLSYWMEGHPAGA